MADRIKGITVEIGGDTTGLDRALNDTGKRSANLSKELDIINKQLKFDPKNTELLAQKQAVLGDAIKNSEDRLKALRQRQEEVNKAFANGDASAEEVRKIERQIIATERKLSDYRGQIDKTGVDLKKLGEIGSAAGKAMAAGIGVAVGAAVALTTALGKMTIGTAKYADEVLTQSAVTGISERRLQEWRYAAELVDVSVDTLTGAMTRNITSMQSARAGSGAAAEAYAKLGVRVTDLRGNLREGETVFNEVIDALGRVGNETERDALAMAILGKSAQDLNPLIKAGSDRMAELAEQANKVGYVLSDEQLAAYGALDDQIQLVKANSEAAARALGVVLLPVMQTFTERGANLIGDFAKSASSGDVKSATAELADGLIDMALDAADLLIDALPDMTEGLLEVAVDKLIPRLLDLIPDLVLKLAELLPVLLENLVPLLASLIYGLLVRLPEILESLRGVSLAIIQSLITMIFQMIRAQWDFAGQLKDIFEGSGGSIIDGIVNGVKARALKLWDELIGFGKNIAASFKRIFGIGDDDDPAEIGAIDVVRRSEVSVYAAQMAEQESMAGRLDELIAAVRSGQTIAIDGDKLVGATADRMDMTLGERAILAGRGAI